MAFVISFPIPIPISIPVPMPRFKNGPLTLIPIFCSIDLWKYLHQVIENCCDLMLQLQSYLSARSSNMNFYKYKGGKLDR